MSVNAYFVVSFIIFGLGFVGVLKRQNLLMLFFSTEIILNSINLALVAISKFYSALDAQIFALFIMAIGACEIVVGLGLMILWYKKTGSIEIESLRKFSKNGGKNEL